MFGANNASPLDTVQLPRPLEGSPALGKCPERPLSATVIAGRTDRPTYTSNGCAREGLGFTAGESLDITLTQFILFIASMAEPSPRPHRVSHGGVPRPRRIPFILRRIDAVEAAGVSGAPVSGCAEPDAQGTAGTRRGSGMRGLTHLLLRRAQSAGIAGGGGCGRLGRPGRFLSVIGLAWSIGPPAFERWSIS